MIATLHQFLTFEEFLDWDDGTDREFELIDGTPMPISEPNANHEDLADRLCSFLTLYCQDQNLPYVPKRSKQIRLKTELRQREGSRKGDIVVFDQTEWLRLKSSPSSAAAYTPPPMVIEVASTNWREDYLTKLAEYEALGILEYWIIDYAAYGATRYIGNPKLPTITVYQLVNEEYQPQKFQGDAMIHSRLFPDLQLTADRVFQMAL